MQEYKRDSIRSQKRTNDLERRQHKWTKHIGSVCARWDRTIRDLDIIMNEDKDAPSSSILPQQLMDVLLPTSSFRLEDDQIQSDSNNDDDDTAAAQQSLARFNGSVANVLKQLQGKAHSSGGGGGIDWQSAIDRLSYERVSQHEIDELKSQVALLSRQLTEERDLLDQRETELRRTLRRFDRSICPTVKAIAIKEDQDNNGEKAPSSPTVDVTTVSGDEGDNEGFASLPKQKSESTSAATTTNGVVSSSATQLRALQEKIDDLKMLSERRLVEIEEKVRENIQLQSQVDALRLQISSIPDHIVAETSYYKQAEASRSFYSAEAQRLQVEVERLFGEISELKNSRTGFEDTVVSEAAAQRQALEVELQRLQNDLVRVRHHRDQIQRELEERKSQDAIEDQKNSELKLLSDVRRERMNALVSENKRLLAYIAVSKGDRSAFETYTDEDLSKTAAVADELRMKLEQLVKREKQLSEQLGALSLKDQSSSAPPEQLMAQLQQVQEEAEGLRLQVQKYEEIVGSKCVDSKGNVTTGANDKDNDSELAAKQKRIDELTLERDGLQRTSEMMERELQTICESFGRLEEQNTSKVWDLSAKEQAIARVVAEKCKYEEKFIGLNKDREAQKQVNQALRNQNSKQMDHIKAIEERDRALVQQLALVGAEAEQATTNCQNTQAELQEAQHRAQELEEQVKSQEERARIAAQTLNERTEALAAMEQEKRRAEEALEAANRRVSEAEKTTDQTGLAKLCADYKALLKCPTCQTNFKSHVLLRCMHVFCKQCIDSRIETRQRKCPSCSEPFGAKDVRHIYL